jgi:hypothetical protein
MSNTYPSNPDYEYCWIEHALKVEQEKDREMNGGLEIRGEAAYFDDANKAASVIRLISGDEPGPGLPFQGGLAIDTDAMGQPPLMVLKDDGKVGIGTAQPAADLSVRGTVTHALSGKIRDSDGAKLMGDHDTDFTSELHINDLIRIKSEVRKVKEIQTDHELVLDQPLAEPIGSPVTVYTTGKGSLFAVHDGAGDIRLTVDQAGNVDAKGAVTAHSFSGSIDADDVDHGTLKVERIPDLDAAKIVTGTLDVDRIPNLDATKITSGTLSVDRIPTLPASKITGQLTTTQLADQAITTAKLAPAAVGNAQLADGAVKLSKLGVVKEMAITLNAANNEEEDFNFYNHTITDGPAPFILVWLQADEKETFHNCHWRMQYWREEGSDVDRWAMRITNWTSKPTRYRIRYIVL